MDGVGALLFDAWHRYGRPVAVSEAFLGAPRHDQVRWLQTVWDAANAARARGVPVQSVTSWSLLGAREWDSLVTRRSGTYEPGAFDLATFGHPTTDIADWIRATVAGQPLPPRAPGWWETSARLLYPPLATFDHGEISLPVPVALR
jgi:dTDP-4-dehydrorhamnose reductase